MTHAVGTTAQQRACRHVIDAYHGELAAGHHWPWLIAPREQTRRAVIDAYTTLTQHAGPEEALAWSTAGHHHGPL